MSTDYFLPGDRAQRMPVARTLWGGAPVGLVVELFGDLRLSQRLVSENGDRLTLRELLARSGDGREVAT